MAIKGDVVLVNFPFTNLSQTKLHPAIVLWVNLAGEDVVVCAVTSQHIERLEEGEFVIDTTDPEFSSTGLRVTSKARATRIATLERQLIVRHLGKLGIQHLQQLNSALVQAFQLS